MPSIFNVYGYKIYFWLNENNEPIHVHVSKGNPTANATKIWITQAGGIYTINSSRIPKKDLARIESFILANISQIELEWLKRFQNITYYC